MALDSAFQKLSTLVGGAGPPEVHIEVLLMNFIICLILPKIASKANRVCMYAAYMLTLHFIFGSDQIIDRTQGLRKYLQDELEQCRKQ